MTKIDKVDNTVCLITPKFNWIYGDIPYPPLAVSYLSAVTNEIGVRTTSVDGTFPREYERKIDEICQKSGPILVGISSTFLQLGEGIRVAKKIKQANKESVVVMGGAGPNCIPNETFFKAADGAVDMISVGESENTWKEIVIEFLGYNGRRDQVVDTFRGIKGTILNSPEPVINPPREFIKDLDTLPMPDLDVIDARRYIETWKKNGGIGSMSIFPSRGCPFSCIFCDKTIFGRKFRVHSPTRIANEMERLVTEYGPIDDIFLFDDNLTTDKKAMRNVCQEILDRKLKVGWSCQARMDTVDEETLRMMHAAGCTDVYFGLEATSDSLLGYLNKKITVEKARYVIDLTKKAKLRPGIFLLTGIPGETEADAKAMMDFVVETKPSLLGFSVLLPFPGTELYRQTKDKIKPELGISPELINDPKRLRQWDDTRCSVYQEGVFKTDPKKSIEDIELAFKEMVVRDQVSHDPSQFIINR